MSRQRTASCWRQRRLRQFLRHERLTVARLLAERDHHTVPWGQTMARSGERARGALHGDVLEEPTPQEPDTRYFNLSDDDSVLELWGTRPDRLAGVRPQERVQRHTVDQIINTAPGLPMLDVPVPLMEQQAEVLHFFDTFSPVAEQVINVLKIILEDIPDANPGSRAAAECRLSR